MAGTLRVYELDPACWCPGGYEAEAGGRIVTWCALLQAAQQAGKSTRSTTAAGHAIGLGRHDAYELASINDEADACDEDLVVELNRWLQRKRKKFRFKLKGQP